MININELIKKLEKRLENGQDIFIGKEKLNVFDASLLLVQLKDLTKKEE